MALQLGLFAIFATTFVLLNSLPLHPGVIFAGSLPFIGAYWGFWVRLYRGASSPLQKTYRTLSRAMRRPLVWIVMAVAAAVALAALVSGAYFAAVVVGSPVLLAIGLGIVVIAAYETEGAADSRLAQRSLAEPSVRTFLAGGAAFSALVLLVLGVVLPAAMPFKLALVGTAVFTIIATVVYWRWAVRRETAS